MVFAIEASTGAYAVVVWLQTGLPEFVPDLIGLVSGVVLLMILAAFGGFVYRQLTGGVVWPDEDEAGDGEGVTRNDGDDDWKYS
jgi:hypothetical protein